MFDSEQIKSCIPARKRERLELRLEHHRVNHGKNEFVRGKQHVNGIEGFWGFAKHRLAKFNEVPKDKFDLYLKECEFRFNLRGGGDIYHELLKLFRKNPLFSNANETENNC
jgi:transposase